MRNIKLLIEYDGTQYLGWQVQPHGPTIQETLEAAVEKITGEKVRVCGAGRTDAGVHALGQAANFITSSRMTPERIRSGLNGVLPSDIAVMECGDVAGSFHARFSARSKRYRYRILNRRIRSALERNRSLFVSVPLDIEAMKKAGSSLSGTHDFSSFGCNAGRDDDPVRTVLALEVSRDGDIILIEIEAVSFLYKMARSMAGTLIDVGRGKLEPDELAEIMGRRDRSSAGATAPPHGLYLVRVDY